MERLEASIQGTIFRNEENGYSVLSVLSGRSEYTVVGALPELNPGEQAVNLGFSFDASAVKYWLPRQFSESSATWPAARSGASAPPPPVRSSGISERRP